MQVVCIIRKCNWIHLHVCHHSDERTWKDTLYCSQASVGPLTTSLYCLLLVHREALVKFNLIPSVPPAPPSLCSLPAFISSPPSLTLGNRGCVHFHNTHSVYPTFYNTANFFSYFVTNFVVVNTLSLLVSLFIKRSC